MNNAIAETIVKQIGNGALAMLGVNELVCDETSVTFRIRGSKTVSHIQVTLDQDDTYTMTFTKVRGLTVKNVAEVSDLQVSQLHQTIETHTGLYTSL